MAYTPIYVFEGVKVQNSTDSKRKFRVGFLILQIYINFSWFLKIVQKFSAYRWVKLLKHKKKTDRYKAANGWKYLLNVRLPEVKSCNKWKIWPITMPEMGENIPKKPILGLGRVSNNTSTVQELISEFWKVTSFRYKVWRKYLMSEKKLIFWYEIL